MDKQENQRLTVKEQQEIKLRGNIMTFKQQELHILQNEYKMFMVKLLQEKGLDPTKKYDIGEDGELKETKTKTK